jgi:hypothetical protein
MFSIPQPLTRLLVILVQQIDHPSPSKTKFETEKKKSNKKYKDYQEVYRKNKTKEKKREL